MYTEYKNDNLKIIFSEYNLKRELVTCPFCSHTRMRDLPNFEIKWMPGWCGECHHMFAYDCGGSSYRNISEMHA